MTPPEGIDSSIFSTCTSRSSFARVGDGRVGLHPTDMPLISDHCTGDPPAINGSEIELTEEVEPGAPEVID